MEWIPHKLINSEIQILHNTFAFLLSTWTLVEEIPQNFSEIEPLSKISTKNFEKFWDYSDKNWSNYFWMKEKECSNSLYSMNYYSRNNFLILHSTWYWKKSLRTIPRKISEKVLSSSERIFLWDFFSPKMHTSLTKFLKSLKKNIPTRGR